MSTIDRGPRPPGTPDDDPSARTTPLRLPPITPPRRRRQRTAVIAGAVAVVLAAATAVAVTQLGGRSAPAVVPTITTPTVPAVPGAPFPAPRRPTADLDASAPLGSVVLAGDQIEAMAGCRPDDERDSVPEEALLPGRLLYLNCFGRVTVIDLASGRPTTVSAASDTAFPGTDHVFTVQKRSLPPGPLTPSREVFALQAFVPRTGAPAWSVDLEGWNPGDGRRPTQVTEGSTGDPAHPRGVHIDANGSTMLDADTGRELWHTMTPVGQYVTSGVDVQGEFQGGYGVGWTGNDARTGKQLWELEAPSSGWAGTKDASFLTDDGVQWQIDDQTWIAYDVNSGAVRSRGMFSREAGSRGIAARPGQAALADDTTITLASIGRAVRPRWTVPGQAEPRVITDDLVAVRGPIGVTFLRAVDGTMLGTLPGADLPAQQARDGLALLSDTSVVKVGTR